MNPSPRDGSMTSVPWKIPCKRTETSSISCLSLDFLDNNATTYYYGRLLLFAQALTTLPMLASKTLLAIKWALAWQESDFEISTIYRKIHVHLLIPFRNLNISKTYLFL